MCLLFLTFATKGQEIEDEDFVIASLLVAAPGDTLYSCLGHACFRMQCPEHNLDFCFSYEGEPASHQMLRFFKGKLKMGMAAVNSQEYIEAYRKEGRGLKQYRLTLPLEVKRRLWKKLDDKVAQGMDLPYDYLKRGCAVTCTEILETAVGKDQIAYTQWPEQLKSSTRRELVVKNMKHAPWSLFCLQTIAGTTTDKGCPLLSRIIIPEHLVSVWQHAELEGRKIIASEPEQLIPASSPTPATWCKPWVLALALLILALLSWIVHLPFVDWIHWALQLGIGLFVTYLVCISDIPNCEWSWLIIPFNPLPILLWKWRKTWMPLYVSILIIWTIAMVCWPHILTDWAYIIFATSMAIISIKEHKNITNIKTKAS